MQEKTHTHTSPESDVQDNRVIAAVGYIGILCLVPLLLRRESSYAQHHGKQGLILLLAWVIVDVVATIPVIGWILFPGVVLGNIFLFIVMIIGIIQALSGNWWKMPLIGDFADKLKF